MILDDRAKGLKRVCMKFQTEWQENIPGFTLHRYSVILHFGDFVPRDTMPVEGRTGAYAAGSAFDSSVPGLFQFCGSARRERRSMTRDALEIFWDHPEVSLRDETFQDWLSQKRTWPKETVGIEVERRALRCIDTL